MEGEDPHAGGVKTSKFAKKKELARKMKKTKKEKQLEEEIVELEIEKR